MLQSSLLEQLFICCSGDLSITCSRLSKHHHKGYIKLSFYPNLAKRVQLPNYPNFKSPQESKMLKQMLANGKGSMDLPLKT
jgi:hypothetical protein